MILEVAIIVCLILVVSMYAGYGGFQFGANRTEGFVSFREQDVEIDEMDEETDTSSKSCSNRKCPDNQTDLYEERNKLLQILTKVQQETHGDPENSAKAGIRVGFERLIAEIDRALEEEGRCVSNTTAEAIIRASRRTFRPN